MQGLPFDETDFPQQGVTVSMSSTWMESPRGMAAAAAAAAASANAQTLQPQNASNPIAIDEEMYGMVATSPQSANPTNVIPHYSPQAMQHRAISQQRQQAGQQHHQQTNPSQQQQPPHPSQTSQQPPPAFSQAHMILPQQPTHRQIQSTNPHMQIHPVVHDPAMSAARSRISVRRRSRGVPDMGDEVVGKTEATVAMEHGISLNAMTAPKRKVARSAVEEARLRAQREAESFANSRRDTSKRDGAGKSMDGGWETGSTERRGKRAKTDVDLSMDTRKGGGSTTSAAQVEEGIIAKKDEDSEVEKQERYKRRLDMNRESAAVSRVRRRAYVKELEERLAAVEAEKLQLEGKLDIMLSQNEDLKKQLDRLFMMVASGRRPTYPPQEEGPGQQ